MKKWIYVTGLMVMISLSTMAQRRGGERPTAEEIATRSTEKMAEELTLTEAQKKQLLAINLEFAKKNEAERKAEMEARKAEMDARKVELKEQDSKIQAVLTDEQKAKWNEVKAERMDDPRRRRPNAQIEGDPRKGKRGGGN
jgi:Spy/CpxP family protein refolding chaperone